MIVRREIEKGLADSNAGRTTPVDEVMKEFGVDEWMSIGRTAPNDD